MPTFIVPEASMTASGFSKLPGRDTLYSHTRFPGLLFKTVQSVGAALAAGGLAMFNAQRTLICVGRTAKVVAQRGLYGKVPMPSATKGFRLGHVGSTGASHRAAQSTIFLPVAYSLLQYLPEDAFAVAVVTKADDGFLQACAADVDRPSQRADITNEDWALVGGVTGTLSGTGGADLSARAWHLATYNSIYAVTNYQLPRRGGFIGYTTFDTASTYLPKVKQELMASVDAELQSLAEGVYSRSLDDFDGVSIPVRRVLHLQDDGSWANSAQVRPLVTPLNIGSAYSDYYVSRDAIGYAKVAAAPAVVNAYVGPANELVNVASASELPVFAMDVYRASVGSAPKTERIAQSPADLITASAVQWDNVQMSDPPTTPAASAPGVLAPILLIAQPTVAPTGTFNLAVDHLNTLRPLTAVLTTQGDWAPTGSSPAEVNASITGRLAGLDGQTALLAAVHPYLGRLGSFVLAYDEYFQRELRAAAGVGP